MKIVRYWPRAVVGDGGITGSVRRWSRALAAQGASCLVAYDDEGEPPAITGVCWRHVVHAGPRGWRLPLDLEKALVDADLLVLHSGWNLSNIAAARVARSAGIPYLLEPRGAYDPGIVARHGTRKRMWWKTLEHELVAHAAAIHLFFDSERPHLAALGYRGPVVIAPNGFEVPADAPRHHGGGGYLLWVGRFDPEHKGLDLLLQGLARLDPAERPPTRLHGPDWRGGKQRTEDLVRRLGLESHVCIGDPVYGPGKWELIAAAAAFTYPSRWEAFGNALAEAAAVGVPTLATPYPLGRCLAEHGVTVVAPATPEGLADGIRRVLSTHGLERAQRAPCLMRREFDWPRVAQRWLAQAEALR